jgi:hypothetical protein
MLSKTELIPARDRLKEADRHLAYVKGSLKKIKGVEEKRVVNDLVGAIEAQRKAVEQMLQVLDTVARCDHRIARAKEPDSPGTNLRLPRDRKNRGLRRDFTGLAQSYFDVPNDFEPAQPNAGGRKSAGRLARTAM